MADSREEGAHENSCVQRACARVARSLRSAQARCCICCRRRISSENASLQASLQTSLGSQEPVTLEQCPICMERTQDVEPARCRHRLCVRCAVQYVRTALGNAAEEVSSEGIRCPMHSVSGCEAIITADCVRALLHISERATPATGSFQGPLSTDEVNNMDRYVVEAAFTYEQKTHCPRCERLAVINPVGENGRNAQVRCPYCQYSWNTLADNAEDAATARVIAGTSKQCPNCGLSITHYHGHGCHHISPGTGCPRCKQHFCYVCLRKHGSPGDRRWHPD